MTDDEWDRVLDVTLTSVFRATRAALRYFREAEHGGVDRQQRQRARLARAALAVALRRGQGRRDGVDPLQRNRSRRARRPDQRGLAEHREAPVPGEDHARPSCSTELSAGEAFGRAAEPWEVANTIVFLASDYSVYLTGEVISVSSQQPMSQSPPNSRRDELLELAATMFAERGLRATTVRDIADGAGILSGSLYHHFASKE